MAGKYRMEFHKSEFEINQIREAGSGPVLSLIQSKPAISWERIHKSYLPSPQPGPFLPFSVRPVSLHFGWDKSETDRLRNLKCT